MTTDENFNAPDDAAPTLRPGLDFAKDLCVINNFALEVATLFFPRFDYYGLNFDETTTDDLYNETDTKAWFTKKNIAATVEWIPPEKRMNKYGVQNNRELEIKVASSVLESINLNPKIGDVVVFENAGYEITELQKEDYFAASLKNVSYLIYAKKTSTRDLPAAVRELANLAV